MTVQELIVCVCLCKTTVLPTLKPLHDAGSESMTPQVGSSVTLRCVAQGFPKPEVTWYKNGQQLAAGNGLKMDDNQLEITGVQVNTSHTCQAATKLVLGLCWLVAQIGVTRLSSPACVTHMVQER